MLYFSSNTGPCEYGGPLGALLAGDTGAVFILEEPDVVPRQAISCKKLGGKFNRKG